MTHLAVWGRDGDAQPADNPSLIINLVCRLVLGVVALLASWVPFRLLWRNGEFAAAVMTVTNWILVLFVVINAAIWHDDDPQNWWQGHGWCDIQTYTQFPMTTIYGACVCAIMRRLAKQVGLLRVTSLSSKEKRNRMLVQALIIFPVPVIQVALTYLVQLQRYTIMPVNGCGKSYDPNVVYLIFFILPSPIFTAVACYYAFQTYRRFREVRKTTRSVLNTNNSTAASRAQRAKRKLYLMAMCILVPYAALELLFLVFNIIVGWPWMKPYDFNAIHNPANWNDVTTFRYDDVSFPEMNMNWVPVITVLVIFVFFGTGKEAVNTYRRYMLALGLGRLFPSLNEEYDPDRRKGSNEAPAWGTHNSEKSRNTASTSQSHKDSFIVPHAHHVSHFGNRPSSSLDPTLSPVSEPESSFPDIQAYGNSPEMDTRKTLWNQKSAIPNPGLNWSTPPKLPPLSIPSFLKKPAAPTAALQSPAHSRSTSSVDVSDMAGPWKGNNQAEGGIRTSVWSDDGVPVSPEGDGRMNLSRKPSSVRVHTHISQETENSGRE